MTTKWIDLDRNGALRPPASFWGMALLLSRHWVWLTLIAATAVVQPSAVQWAYSGLDWPLLVAELPMLLLLVAFAQRVPDAGALPRMVWRHGRTLIVLACALSAAWASWLLAEREVWNPLPERLMALFVLLELVVAAVVLRSPVYRDLFDDFPQASSGH